MSGGLLIRNVEIEGRTGLDVRIAAGRVAEVGRRLRGTEDALDGAGGALIPGLIDHHIHLLGLAAQADSVRLDTAADASDLAARLAAAAGSRPPGAWLRATGYHEAVAGVLGASELDRLAPRHPLRVQHRSGALWMLNTPALACALRHDPPPPCVELDGVGQPTGRVWRGDAWLSARIGRVLPPLAPVGRTLAACGVTGVTDASPTTDVDSATKLAAAHEAGDLPQRLMLMSGGPLAPLPGVAVGPVKVLLDEADLPDLDGLVARIAQARSWRRRVAMHCATAVELAFALAAFEVAGTEPGDRIEHGSVIPEAALPVIAALGLTVVTQPAFVAERGDRYLAEVSTDDQAGLYRIASLRRAGAAVAASSDAPYAGPDPWAAMRSAVDRRTRLGASLGPAEAVDPATALSLYLGGFARPGGRRRRVAAGAAADLCLLVVPLGEALQALDAGLVAATLVAGRLAFDRRAGPATRAA
jgi:predicted amidohydrolase YtcJ